jgi:DNA-directed RNA polymerase specialized sigma24 family protein
MTDGTGRGSPRPYLPREENVDRILPFAFRLCDQEDDGKDLIQEMFQKGLPGTEQGARLS